MKLFKIGGWGSIHRILRNMKTENSVFKISEWLYTIQIYARKNSQIRESLEEKPFNFNLCSC